MRLLLSAGPSRPAGAAEWVDVDSLVLAEDSGLLTVAVAAPSLDEASSAAAPATTTSITGIASTRYGRSSSIALGPLASNSASRSGGNAASGKAGAAAGAPPNALLLPWLPQTAATATGTSGSRMDEMLAALDALDEGGGGASSSRGSSSSSVCLSTRAPGFVVVTSETDIFRAIRKAGIPMDAPCLLDVRLSECVALLGPWVTAGGGAAGSATASGPASSSRASMSVASVPEDAALSRRCCVLLRISEAEREDGLADRIAAAVRACAAAGEAEAAAAAAAAVPAVTSVPVSRNPSMAESEAGGENEEKNLEAFLAGPASPPPPPPPLPPRGDSASGAAAAPARAPVFSRVTATTPATRPSGAAGIAAVALPSGSVSVLFSRRGPLATEELAEPPLSRPSGAVVGHGSSFSLGSGGGGARTGAGTGLPPRAHGGGAPRPPPLSTRPHAYFSAGGSSSDHHGSGSHADARRHGGDSADGGAAEAVEPPLLRSPRRLCPDAALEALFNANAAPPPPTTSSSRGGAAATAPTPAPSANRPSLSKILDPRTLGHLRALRRRPDLVLRHPAQAYAMLVNACKQLDKAVHAASLSGGHANGGGDAGFGSGVGGGDWMADAALRLPSSSLFSSPGGGGSSSASAPPAASPQPAAPPPLQLGPELLQEPVRRRYWEVIAGRYLTVLCDHYTAGIVFDALTVNAPLVSIRSLVPRPRGPSDSEGGGSGAGGSGAPGASSGAPITTMAWVQVTEKMLSFDLFARYTAALARPLLTPPAAWEALREALCLDPLELVVKVEEYTELVLSAEVMAAVRADAGTSGGAGGADSSSSSRRGALQKLVVLPASQACKFPLAIPPSLVTPGRSVTVPPPASAAGSGSTGKGDGGGSSRSAGGEAQTSASAAGTGAAAPSMSSGLPPPGTPFQLSAGGAAAVPASVSGLAAAAAASPATRPPQTAPSALGRGGGLRETAATSDASAAASSTAVTTPTSASALHAPAASSKGHRSSKNAARAVTAGGADAAASPPLLSSLSHVGRSIRQFITDRDATLDAARRAELYESDSTIVSSASEGRHRARRRERRRRGGGGGALLSSAPGGTDVATSPQPGTIRGSSAGGRSGSVEPGGAATPPPTTGSGLSRRRGGSSSGVRFATSPEADEADGDALVSGVSKQPPSRRVVSTFDGEEEEEATPGGQGRHRNRSLSRGDAYGGFGTDGEDSFVLVEDGAAEALVSESGLRHRRRRARRRTASGDGWLSPSVAGKLDGAEGGSLASLSSLVDGSASNDSGSYTGSRETGSASGSGGASASGGGGHTTAASFLDDTALVTDKRGLWQRLRRGRGSHAATGDASGKGGAGGPLSPRKPRLSGDGGRFARSDSVAHELDLLLDDDEDDDEEEDSEEEEDDEGGDGAGGGAGGAAGSGRRPKSGSGGGGAGRVTSFLRPSRRRSAAAVSALFADEEEEALVHALGMGGDGSGGAEELDGGLKGGVGEEGGANGGASGTASKRNLTSKLGAGIAALISNWRSRNERQYAGSGGGSSGAGKGAVGRYAAGAAGTGGAGAGSRPRSGAGGRGRGGSDGGAAPLYSAPRARQLPHPSTLTPAAALQLYQSLGLHPYITRDLLHRGRAVVRVSGTTVLTDRNLYFWPSRNEVLVIPIAGISGAIEPVRTTVKTLGMLQLGRTSDNGLMLTRCEVRRVVADAELDAATLQMTPLQSLFAVAAGIAGKRAPVALGGSGGGQQHPQTHQPLPQPPSTDAEGGAEGEILLDLDGDADGYVERVVSSGPSGSMGTTAAASAAGGLSSGHTTAAAATTAAQSTSDGVLLVRPTVTLVFSRVKDLLLGRGQERFQGGRRRVVREALGELIAAHQVGADYAKVLDTLVELKKTGKDEGGGSGSGSSARKTPAPVSPPAPASPPLLPARGDASSAAAAGLSSPVPPSLTLSAPPTAHKPPAPAPEAPALPPSQAGGSGWLSRLLPGGNRARRLALAQSLQQAPSTPGPVASSSASSSSRGSSSSTATRSSSSSSSSSSGSRPLIDMSPWLLAAGHRGLYLGSLLSLPDTVAAWKAQLRREGKEDALFSRRLQLYAAVNIIRTRALLKATGRQIEALYHCSHYLEGTDEGAAETIRRLMITDDPRWLLKLGEWMTHARDVRRRREEGIVVFDRRVFTYEMNVMLDTFVFPINLARHVVLYTLAWETPLWSLLVFISLLLIAWHEALPYALPLTLLGHVFALLLYGALNDGDRARVLAVCSRTRTARGRTLLERLRNFRTTLGNNQLRMHRLNDFALRVRSLYTWRDPTRTRIFIGVLVAIALLFTVVPFRVLFTAFVVHRFTAPLRSPEKGLVTLAIQRFWRGLPVPSISDPVYVEMAPEDRALAAALAPASVGGEGGEGAGAGGGGAGLGLSFGLSGSGAGGSSGDAGWARLDAEPLPGLQVLR